MFQSSLLIDPYLRFARAEVLGALISVVTIWMVTGMLVAEAVNRILNPTDVDGKCSHSSLARCTC